MILVDISAWIDFFRDRKPIANIVDQALDENSAAICGPIYTELLRGFKHTKERDKVIPLLQSCRFLTQPFSLWETAGQFGFQLKCQGVTVKTLDLLIACFAMAHGLPILAVDRDFKTMQSAGMNILLIN
jgi:predicted nucleic acid-binding protein